MTDDTTAAMQQRLTQLQAEHAQGTELLAQAEAEVVELRSTLLRISGAIQVLEELLAEG